MAEMERGLDPQLVITSHPPYKLVHRIAVIRWVVRPASIDWVDQLELQRSTAQRDTSERAGADR